MPRARQPKRTSAALSNNDDRHFVAGLIQSNYRGFISDVVSFTIANPKDSRAEQQMKDLALVLTGEVNESEVRIFHSTSGRPHWGIFLTPEHKAHIIETLIPKVADGSEDSPYIRSPEVIRQLRKYYNRLTLAE